MNWLKKTLDFGQKIKKLLKKRPTVQDMEESDWTSCCKGPILKKIQRKIYGYAQRVINILGLILNKDLTYYLVKKIIKF